MNRITALAIALVLPSQCHSQIIEFDSTQVPVQVKPAPSLEVPSEGDLPSKVYVVGSPDSVHSQLRVLYNYCPGMVTSFEKMRSVSSLRLSRLDGIEVFNQKLDEALKEREKLMEKATEFDSSSIFMQKNFVEQILATELRNDKSLSLIFSELLPPEKLPTYISALGPGCENGLLTSHLYREFASISDKDFARRLKLSRDFLEWAVKSANSKDVDFELGKAKVRLLYADLSVREFLDLKYLLGQSRAGETISQYMNRIKDKKADLADYVSAIDKELENKK